VGHVVGIDAGATKSVGLLADENGRVEAEARSGGANLQTDGELVVEKTIHELLESLGVHGAVSALCLGIAGLDRPGEEEVIAGVLRRLGLRDRVRIVNDAVIALVAGAPERVGIVLLSGTGSIAYGMDRTGRTARSGGLGHLLADEGSAYWLGHEALRASVRAADGRGPQTALSSLVLEALGTTAVSGLPHLVYGLHALPRARLAALAPNVEQAARSGDAVAVALLDQAASELALAGRSVAGQLGLGDEPFPVVLAGGAFRACPSLFDRIGRVLGLPHGRLRLLTVEPAVGAVTLALDLLRG
jgi:glucosamine kinase